MRQLQQHVSLISTQPWVMMVCFSVHHPGLQLRDKLIYPLAPCRKDILGHNSFLEHPHNI